MSVQFVPNSETSCFLGVSKYRITVGNKTFGVENEPQPIIDFKIDGSGSAIFFVNRTEPLFEFLHLYFLSGDVKNFEMQFPDAPSPFFQCFVLENCRITGTNPPEYDGQDIRKATFGFNVEFEGWYALVSKPAEDINEEQPQT